MDRRKFAKNTVLATAMASIPSVYGLASNSVYRTRRLKKGIMWGSIKVGETVLEKFQAAKAAGFDGVEVMSHLNREEVLEASNTTGLAIPSVCNALHWKFLLSDPSPDIRQKGVEALKLSLEDAKKYSADTVLLVPGRVNEKVSYDECWNRTVTEIKKVIPLAEELNVTIAIENVWNNFLLSPLEATNYVDQFESSRIGFYFDCGNILVYGWPEQWIQILGPRIAKVHIKEFSRDIANKKGKGAGFGVKLLEGNVNWPAVMTALANISYNGWTTIEQPGGDTAEGLKDLCDRLEKIHTS